MNGKLDVNQRKREVAMSRLRSFYDVSTLRECFPVVVVLGLALAMNGCGNRGAMQSF